MGRGVQERVSENGEVEVVREQSGLQLNRSCFDSGCDDLHYSNDEMSIEDDDSYLPLPRRRPNRKSSLIEYVEDEITVPSLILQHKGIEHPTFHPALKAAILAEGQEAMWVEDEISTVTQVVVDAPPVPKPSTEKPPKAKKRRGKFLFGSKRPEAIPEEEEKKIEESEPQTIEVKKIKIKKAVVLLPQHGGEGAKALAEANVAQEAAINMAKARQLLQQALVAEGTPRLEESEKMAKVAFAHATAARRLMSAPGEGPNLDHVLYSLTERGEHAVYQHQRIVFSQSFEDTPKYEEHGMVSDFASKAFHYLESILPSNVEQGIEETVSDDVWTEEGLSSLGVATDTFEYKLDQTSSRQASTDMDLVSLSSLNEILDGPIDDENRPPSPRQVLPVIDVPNRHAKRAGKPSKRVEQTVSTDNDMEAGNENINRNFKEEDINIPEKTKTKWGLLGNFLGKRQNNQVQRQKESPARPEKGKQEQTETKTAKVIKKTESLQSEDNNRIKKKGSSGQPRYPSDVLPSFPSKSLDSEHDEGSKTDRYKSAQFKKSEEKNYHVSFDNSVPLDKTLNKSNSDGKNGGLSIETKTTESAVPAQGARGEIENSNQDLHIQKGRSAEYSMMSKSLNTVDWDENVHRHPNQSLSIETSNDDWDVSVHKLPRNNLDPIVSDQDGNHEEAKSKAEVGEESKVDDTSGATNHLNNESKDGKPQDFRRKPQDRTRETEPLKAGDTGDARTGSHDNTHRYQNYGKADNLTRRREESPSRKGGNHVDETERFKEERRNETRDDGHSFESVRRDQKREETGLVAEPVVAEANAYKAKAEATRRPNIEDDSLINFVISPGRIELPSEYGANVAVSANPPPANERQLNAIAEKPISNNKTIQTAPTQKDIKHETSSLQSGSKSVSKNPRIMARIAGIFGGKSKSKARNQPGNTMDQAQVEANDEGARIEKSASTSKDLEQAISDGNMRAVEANENAEDAPTSCPSKKNAQKVRKPTLSHSAKERPMKSTPSKHKVSNSSGDAERAGVDVIEIRSSGHDSNEIGQPDHSQQLSEESIIQAIKKGSSKAEETNINSEDAPILQHLKSLKRKQQDGRKSEKGGERNHHHDHKTSSLSEMRKADPGPHERTAHSKRKDPANSEKKQQDSRKSVKEGDRNHHRDHKTSSLSERRKADPVPHERTIHSKGRKDPTNNDKKTSSAEGAPTPRRSDNSSSHDRKYDQKAVTARLYGGDASAPSGIPTRSEPSRKHRQAVKHVYIGDLVDSNPATMSTHDSEDSYREVRNKPADPSVSGERRSVRGTDPS
jgi:hypothetical protein